MLSKKRNSVTRLIVHTNVSLCQVALFELPKKNVGGWGDIEHIFLWGKFKIKVENRSNHSMNNGISLFRKKPGATSKLKFLLDSRKFRNLSTLVLNQG